MAVAELMMMMTNFKVPNKFILSLTLSLLCRLSFAQDFSAGGKLPGWQEGYLDLHHINTGRGSCMFAVLPDGTTLMIDAGELSPLDERTFTPRNAVIRPDSSRKPFEWIARYIKNISNGERPKAVDYALLTHFHDDHFGAWYPYAPRSRKGNYFLTGITGVGELLGINMLIDRGHPYYRYPKSLKAEAQKHAGGEIKFDSTMSNYFRFINYQMAKGMMVDSFRAGSKTQVTLRVHPEKFGNFYIQNIKSNQWIWTGRDSTVKNLFPENFYPDENSLSLALVIRYGDFSYYTGGDNPGNVFPGDNQARNVETPISEVVGAVDVAVMDHHGNRDALNPEMIKNLSARVWIGQTWSADHPGHEVLIRLTNKFTNPAGSDLFATNMLDANRHVIGPLIDRSYKSQQGHVIVRVMPGGKQYYVLVLDDTSESMKIKSAFGPYNSKKKS